MSDPFVIYSMGDTNLHMAILNGIAMLFGGSSLYSGNGAFGLGLGAFFGSIVLLTFMLYNAVFKKQLDFKILVAPLLLYFLMTVPKVDVAIQDIYSYEAVKRVDNVPLGLAVPLSVASGVSYVLTIGFETAYSVVSNEQDMMPRLTDSGYVTPLKLINALRTATTREGSSSLFQTAKNFHANCISNNPNFSPEQYMKSTNPLLYLTQVTQSNNGLVWIVQEGTSEDNPRDLVTCQRAAEIISSTLDSIMDGVKNPRDEYNIVGDVSRYNLSTIISGEMISNGSASGSSPKLNAESRASGLTGYRYEDVTGAFAQITSLSESQARDFVAATLFSPYLQSAAYCADTRSGNDLTGLSRCTAWVSSVSQWEEKNAASATGFLKILQDGQNILIFFAIAIYPIIVLLIMFQGVASFKAVVDYFMFMTATLLWIPIASVFNFYIQFNLAEELRGVVETMGSSGLSLFTASQFYGAVAQKLALGNGLLSLTPILCMLLFKGMSMATNYMQAKMNSADGGGYDAKVNTPDIQKSAPIATTNSAIVASGQNVISESGLAKTSISASNSFSAMEQKTKEAAESRALANSKYIELGQKYNATIAEGENSSTVISNMTQSSEGQVSNSGTTIMKGTENAVLTNDNESLNVSNVQGHQNSDGNTSITQGSVNANAGLVKNQNSKDTNKNAKQDDKDKDLVSAVAGGSIGVGSGLINSNSSTDSTGVNIGDVKAVGLVKNNGEKESSGTVDSSGIANSYNTMKSVDDRLEFLKREEVKEEFSKNAGLRKAYDETVSALVKATQSQNEVQAFGMVVQGDVSEIVGTARKNQQGYNELKDAIYQSDDKENIEKSKNQYVSRSTLLTGRDAEVGGYIIGAMSSSDPNVQEKARSILYPNAATNFSQTAERIGNTEIPEVQKQTIGAINTAGLDPTKANNLKSVPQGGMGNTNPNQVQNKVKMIEEKPLDKNPSKAAKEFGEAQANQLKKALRKTK